MKRRFKLRRFPDHLWFRSVQRLPPLAPEHRAQGGACQARGDCPWCEA